MGDFNHDQPTPQAQTSTEFAALTSDTPTEAGTANAPRNGNAGEHFEKGAGVGNSRRGIH